MTGPVPNIRAATPTPAATTAALAMWLMSMVFLLYASLLRMVTQFAGETTVARSEADLLP
jgi:hypothetical protein